MEVSAYARNALLVLLAGFGAVWLIILLLLLALFCCAGRMRSFPQGKGVSILAGVLILLEQGITTVGLALIAGFGFFPTWVSFLVSAALWAATLAIVISLFISGWRTTLLVARLLWKGGGGASRGSASADLESGKPKAVPSENRGCCLSVVGMSRASFQAAMQRPVMFLVATFAALSISLGVNLALAGVCYCTQPTLLTSWATRRAEPRYCNPGEFCHLYAVVGTTSQKMRLVGHFVAASRDDPTVRPWSSSASVCEMNNAVSPARCGPTWTVNGTIVDHAVLSEDPRYLAHILLSNLSTERHYQAIVSLHGLSEQQGSSATTAMATKTIEFYTLPDEQSASPVRMLVGGDVYQGKVFTDLLIAGLAKEPNPHMIVLGGDLAYANNQPTCYLRWDAFLKDLSAVRTAAGVASVPILTIPGNHESGGYLTQNTRSDYYFYTQYFPQYDEDTPVDPTITYHSHRFGPKLGIVALDSGLMVPVESQVAYLQSTLTAMVNPNSPSTSKFVIVMYHNPAYPSSRGYDDSHSVPIRKLFTPLFDTHRVPLALEFHDHVYKRTKPMKAEEVQSPGLGTIYAGDGALGVYSSKRKIHPDRAYLDTTAPENYILILTALTNGTMTVEALSEQGTTIDSFTVYPRV